jgi:hypothetical protein
MADRSANLIRNGSFESRAAGDPALPTVLFWSGQPNLRTPFFFGLIPPVANSAPTAVIPDWTQSSGPGAYGLWGPSSGGFSAPCSDGIGCLYFGNWSTVAAPAPTFNSDGTVGFATTPTFTNTVALNQPPTVLSQTLTGLTIGATYLLDFWTTGEFDNGQTGLFPDPGVFGLRIGGDSLFLTVPTVNSVFHADNVRYYVVFSATSAVEILSFTNWGHIIPSSTAPTTRTELILDDVIVNRVSEPASVALLAAALVGLCTLRRWRKAAAVALVVHSGRSASLCQR